jgi:M6 family metalloprotease-like protein
LVIIIAFLLIGVIILPSTTGIISRNHIFLKENDNMFQNIDITHTCQCGGGFSKTKIPSISPVYGKRPILLVLIEFLDQPHSPNHDFNYFNDIVWDGVTSVADYFLEVSYGQFTFTKAGILGWYSSSRCRIDEWEDNFVEISQEAFEIASQDQSFNFSQFDKNDDQIITYDELSIIIVSSGTQYQPSFAYYVRDSIKNIVTWDGVSLDGECCFVSERWDWSSYAHELGHSLGLPDLYDYSFVDVTGDSYGVGPYDIMCSTYHKSHFSAWCKIRLGWIEPVIVENDGYYEVHDVETHPEVYLLPVPYRDSEEYFLVENRWRGINYDLQLPDHGIVIWHIDDSRLGEYWGGTVPRPNNNNNDEAHKLVDVECADNPSSHFVNADDFDAIQK